MSAPPDRAQAVPPPSPQPLPAPLQHDAPPTARAAPVPHVDSAALFDGSRELVIEHRGERYHLRITRHEKLILTK